MHPYIFSKFEEILSQQHFSGPVLEVGAIPNPKALLKLPVLKDYKDKTGINLSGPYNYEGFVIHKGNANKMDIFPDNHFGLVMCNAMLEHDQFFWKTIAEINRVTRPGGLVIIGTPGFSVGRFQRFKSRFKKYVWYKKLKTIAALDFIMSSTLTFEVHGNNYGDYYRFSPAAYREVFFRGYTNVQIISVMKPPRIIGYGYKPEKA
jgi:SAM-dependent methyltransferase